jgi:hypothetical protein
MPYTPQLTLEGAQEVQARNLRRIANMKPEGAAGEAVRDASIALHRHAVQITHVGKYTGGGALKNSHRIRIEGLEAAIYIDPAVVSPRRSGKRKYRPVVYGVYEHERGGEHAFYDRTIDEIGGQVSARASRHIMEAVIYGK